MMKKEDVFTEIRDKTSYLLGIEKEEIDMSSSFKNDLGCDSLMMSELVMEFEDRFGITISDNEAEELITVSSVVEFIHKRCFN